MDFWTRHIPDEVLTDYAEGRAAAVALSPHLQQHTQECRRCGRQLSVLDKLLTTMRADESRDAAPEMLTWASQAFRARRRTVPVSLVKKIQAVLRVELSPFAPAFGERSAPSAERQFLYQAGDYELDLRCVEQGSQWRLSGQILGPSATGVTARLSSETHNVSAPLNDLAEFILPAVPAGVYQLEVAGSAVNIEVTDINLR